MIDELNIDVGALDIEQKAGLAHVLIEAAADEDAVKAGKAALRTALKLEG